MKRLEFAPGVWSALMADLFSRGGGCRESGAFLLRDTKEVVRVVQTWLPYDELDPNSLNWTHVRLDSGAFSRLWSICSERNLEVIADIHTHPWGAHQSLSDRTHPMISLAGHIALIVPWFARGKVRPQDVSFNVYQGNGKWVSFFCDAASSMIKLQEEI